MITRIIRACWRFIAQFATRVAATVLALFVFDVSKATYRAMKRQAMA